MPLSSADEYQWRRLCRRHTKRAILPLDFELTQDASGVDMKTRWPRNPILLILSLKGFIFGGLMLGISFAIATGLKQGRPEYIWLLGAVGLVCIMGNSLAWPVQRIRLGGGSFSIVSGMFPFQKSFALHDDGNYRLEIQEVAMPIANDRHQRSMALCLMRHGEKEWTILVADQNQEILQILKTKITPALSARNW